MLRISAVILLIVALVHSASAQSINYDLMRVIPPSPTAASIAKYGDVPVSYYTGVPNISIPIYNVQNRDISVPITLSYHSGGIRVDEEASWVGLGWNLSAGGAITRTVRGGDDLGVGGYPDSYIPTSLTPGTDEYVLPMDPAEWTRDISFVEEVLTGQADSEPDAFVLTFNGRSVKFFLNKRTNPSQPLKCTFISQADLQFEASYSSVAQTYKWTVTDETGTKYYFGTQEKSVSRTAGDRDEFLADQHVLDGIPEEVVLSWYLDSIVSVTGARVQFNYENASLVGRGTRRIFSRSQTKSQLVETTMDNPFCILTPNIFDYFTTSTETQDVYLKEIIFPNGKVEFVLSNRTDIEPVPGAAPLTYAKKLDEIVVTADSKVIKRQSLTYSYFGGTDYKTKRLKLLAVTETTGTVPRPPHEFSYNSLALPAKDSKRIDHWGYFNNAPNETVNDNRYGDVSLNGTLIPATSVRLQNGTMRDYLGANREPNPSYNQACILTEIKYPTGGTTHFEYETNEYYGNISKIVTSTGEAFREKWGPESGQQSPIPDTITVTFPQPASIQLTKTLTCRGTLENPCIPEGETWEYDFVNITSVGVTPPFSQWLGHTLASDAQWSGISETVDVSLPAGTYKFTVLAEGNLAAKLLISWSYRDTIHLDTDLGGGLRIKSMLAYDGISHNNDRQKRFEYKTLINGVNKSSGALMVTPIYEFKEDAERQCETTPFNPVRGTYFTRTTSPFVPFSNSAMGNSVGYSAVDEIVPGLGKTTYEYHNTPDGLPIPFLPNVPTRPSLGNGLERKQTVFKEEVNGSYTRVNETEKLYVPDNNRNYFAFGMKVPPSAIWHVIIFGQHYNAYTFRGVSFYRLESQFWHQVDEKVTTYSQTAGDVPLVETSYLKYDHPVRLQITGRDIIDSRGQTVSTTFKYPYDFPSDPVCVQMVAKNHISALIEQVQTVGATHRQTLKAVYVTSSGIQLPGYVQVKTGNGSMETRLRYHAYSDKGQLLSQSKESDVPMSYKWGYSDQYPVAEVSNAQPNEFYYESFEEGGNTGTLQAGAKTGRRIKEGSFTVSFTPPNTKEYLLSYWYKTSAGGAWLYKERTYTGTQQVINDGVWVDEVRVHPKNAQMITRSYVYMVGISSETDASGKTVYYEYNDFNELKLIRDQDGKIVKQFDYQYNVNP
ncbi:hypothetical protein [Chitinophaga barathri]|uniref:RHS repeat protein n=1 Tax=Chitinophaga barathri TaxID=1647451 RepID=A0A3N4MGN5_9BACT|nr:hypothetical protein [Chitinophaga barathri]RPD42748.1 hypothetical protein EG028_00160 [Chitinophaga barathri]